MNGRFRRAANSQCAMVGKRLAALGLCLALGACAPASAPPPSPVMQQVMPADATTQASPECAPCPPADADPHGPPQILGRCRCPSAPAQP